MSDAWDQERTQILAANTAQGVYRHLRNLESNRARVLPRWIWELLQNARDVARAHASLTAIVEFDGRRLTFGHDGRPFERREITHLIYYGSTKLELDETLGQFGSGFLTTHLLSPTIDVSSRLDDGRSFAFQLDRSGADVADLQHRMDASWDAFKSSLSLPRERDTGTALTTFGYPIDERAGQAIAEGIDALARSGPYVAAFNREFKCIRMRLPAGETVLELADRVALAEHTAEVRVAVTERDGGAQRVGRYLVSELDGVAIAMPFTRTDGNAVLEPVADAPRLALGFPLIGTEAFSFPAVIHSSRFAPTEERDGVFLGQGDNDANLGNQAVLEEACRLLLATIAFAAKSGWANAFVLARIPRIRAYSWLRADWLRDQLRELLVDPLRTTPAVVPSAGGAIAPADAVLPIADTPEAVHRLWALAADVGALRHALPRRSEAQGWCEAIGSWADIHQCSPGSIEGTNEGRDLALRAQEARSLDAMRDVLAGDADPCEWLTALHGFLADDGAADLSRTLRIVPDQTGRFGKLSDLHRDRDIPDRLKDIAELVGWELRAELRDGRLPVLAEESGAGDVGPDDVVRRLIQDLRERMEAQLDDPSKAASVRLFGWIVEHERWRFLHGYPAFSDEDERSALIRLDRHDDDDTERPLAPVPTWPDDLREYAALFPRRHTLATAFADEAGDPAVWATLEDRGFLRRNVLYSRMAVVADFLPDEPLPDDDEQSVEHRADEAVAVSEVAFLTKTDVGVQSRVRQSRALAQLFWSFLTQWLVVQDAQAFEAGEVACACGRVHRYFPARLAGSRAPQQVGAARRSPDRPSDRALPGQSHPRQRLAHRPPGRFRPSRRPPVRPPGQRARIDHGACGARRRRTLRAGPDAVEPVHRRAPRLEAPERPRRRHTGRRAAVRPPR